jgi:hypothetical protein
MRSTSHISRLLNARCAPSPWDARTFLFAGSNAGADRVAAIHSLLGSAKLNCLDPEIYLHHVLGRIAELPINRIIDLSPWNLSLPRKYDHS